MKKVFSKIADYSRKLIPFVFIAIAFLIPIYQRGAIIGLIVLSGIWLLSGNWLNLIGAFKNNLLLLSLIAYWLLHAVSILYSDNVSVGLSDIQQKLSFMAFPLIAISSAKQIVPRFRTVIMAFLFGVGLMTVFSLIQASFLSLQIYNEAVFFDPHPLNSAWENFFLYSLFALPFHPTYYSMHIILGVAFLFGIIKENRSDVKIIVLSCLGIAYFLVILLMLSSKAAIITFVIVFTVGCLWLFLKKVGGVFKLVFAGLILVFLFQIAMHNQRFSVLLSSLGFSVEQSQHYSDEELEHLVSGTSVRLNIWKNIPDIVGDNWLNGFGVGDAKQELVEGYKKHGIKYAFEYEYNAHNQYLETFVSLGVIGLVLLAFVLGQAMYISFSQRDIVALMFIVIICLNMLFESIFERIAGVMFFGFFLSLFFVNRSEQVE
ncbi:MAG TPA: O-antigen ligase family protein [Tenuifilaceae bacterium]|nr:O-antigen ligase family protein [Tenuifilaceae bacterium]